MRIINITRFQIIIAGWFFLFGLTPVFSAIQLISQKSDTLLFQVTFDSVSSQNNNSGSDSWIIHPAEVILLRTESGIINTNILKTIYGDQEIDPNVVVDDIALGLDDQPEKQSNNNLPSNLIELQKIYQFSTGNVYRLTLHGIVTSGGAKAKSIREMKFYCAGPGIAWIDDAASRTEMIGKYQESASSLAKSNQTQIGTSALPFQSSRLLKIWVKKDGIYTIPRSMMTEAGWDVRHVNPRNFRMTNRGKEIPIYVSGESDGSFDLTDCVEFRGEQLWHTDENGDKQLDVYSEYNIYWLEIGSSPGLRLVDESGQPALEKDRNTVVPKYFMVTEHIEQNNSLNRLPYGTDATDEDYWLMSGRIPNREMQSFSLPLTGLEDESEYLSSLRVKLNGQTASTKDQSAQVFLNNYMIGETSWPGSVPPESSCESFVLSSESFSSLYLESSGNSISVFNPSISEEYVTLYCDWIEITYPRQYMAVGDYIRFYPGPTSMGKRCRFEIEAFQSPDISIYKPGSSQIMNYLVEEVTDTLGQISYTLIFEDEIQNIGTEYIALTANQKMLPDSTALIELQGIRSREFEGDYVIVTPSDTLGRDLLQPLIELHESEGYRVTCVSLDTIYNEFNFGIPNPLAIQAFLKYGYTNWDKKPKFLLLIGDANYSRRFNPTENMLPSPWYQTYKFGGAPSDHIFTLLDGDDDAPEIAVGRFPVATREELIKLVGKTVNHIQTPHASWQNSYLLIGSDAKGETFYNQSEYLIANILPPKMEPKRLYLAGNITDPFVGGKEDLRQYFSNGLGLINFRGHGGGAIWKDKDLMTNEDGELLENLDKLPIITSMTCFTADFASTQRCLGETLLLAENGGAIGFWGASGTGWTNTDFWFIQEVYKIMADEPELTIGETLQKAKTIFRLKYSNSESISDVYQYNYLGDPAVRLPFPSQEVVLTSTSPSIETDGSIQVEGLTGSADCQAEFQVVEGNGHPIYKTTDHFNGTAFQKSIPISSLSEAEGLRLHVWDEESDYHANAYFDFKIGSMYIDSLQVLPTDLTASDSLYFQTDLVFYRPLESVYVLIFNTQIDSGLVLPDSIRMIPVNQTYRYRSSVKLPPLHARNHFSYSLRLKDTDGQVYIGDTQTFTYPTWSSFGVQSVSLLDSNQVYLKTKIQNYGGLWVKNLPVQFNIPSLSYQYTDTLSIKGGEAATVIVPFFAPMGNYQCAVYIDPYHSVDTSNTSFDTLETTIAMNRVWITPEAGSTIRGTKNDTLGLDDQIWMYAPPQAVNVPLVIKLGYQYQYLGDYNTIDTTRFIKSMTLSSSADNVHFNKPFQFIVYGPVSVFNQNSKLQFFDVQTNRWIVKQFAYADSFFTCDANQLGDYRLINATDVQSPWISVTADHQPVANGCYLDKRATLQISIEDDSGVDIRSESIRISIDQKQYALTEMTWQDSLADPAKASFMFAPDLKNGTHILNVQAMDIHGNMNQLAPIQFTVNDEMDVKFLGNYPNPFEKNTVFTYFLTSSARHVRLKIYTVSGRLIRTFDDLSMTSADYHEVIWDGRDDWGDEVANGVYFFKLSVKGFEKSMDIKGKIAKLKL